MDDITNRRFDRVETAIAEVRAEVRTLAGEVGTLRGEVGTLRGEVGTLRGEVGTLRGEVGTLAGDMVQVRLDIGALKADVHEIKDDIERHFRELLQEGQSHGVLLGRLTGWLDDDTRARVIKLEEQMAEVVKAVLGPKQ